MDLSEIIVPEGLTPKPIVTCVIEGHLEEEDLRELTLSVPTEVVEGDDPADLKKLREKHHSVARMIAGGLQQRMVAQLCGYNESYLSVLLNNPSMQELIELYRIQQGSAQLVAVEKMRTIGLKALEKLEDKIEDLSHNELLQLAKLGADRGGLGPTSTHHNVNETHIVDHAEIAKRNDEARARSAKHIVPSAEVRAKLAPPQPTEQNVETDRNLDTQTAGLPEPGEQSGLQEQGS